MSELTPRTDAFLLERIEELERENNELRENYNRVFKEQRESFEHYKEAKEQFREGTWYGRTTKDYTDSIQVSPDEETGFFSLAYQWQDKKHRHVFDLCDWINALQDKVEDFHELVNLITIQEESDSGRLFYPNGFTSCRAMDGERMGQITEKYRKTPHIEQGEE